MIENSSYSENKSISKLLRKLYLNKRDSVVWRKTAQDLELALDGYLYLKLSNKQEGEDVKQNFWEVIIKSFDKSSEIWESTKEDNDDNNKRIFGYFEKTITSIIIKNRAKDNINQNPELLLKKACKNICNKLVERGYLFSKGNLYSKNNSFDNVFSEELNIAPKIFWKGNYRINNKALQNYIENIFDNYLENLAINISDLVKGISRSNNFGIASVEVENKQDDEVKTELTDEDALYALTGLDYRKVVDEINSNLDQNFGDEFLRYLSVFLYYNHFEKGLEEIAKIENIGKSSVANYNKKFLGELRNLMNKYCNNSFEQKKLLEYFIISAKVLLGTGDL